MNSTVGTKGRELSEAAEKQRLYDRARPEYTQAKGHNQRIKERYPETWAKSTLTNESLAEWITTAKLLSCPYCADPVKEIDHKIPLSKGGEHSVDNLQMLCLDCNRSKHDMTDEEFKAVKATEPKKIKYGRKYEYSELKDNGRRFRTRSLFVEMWKLTKNQDYPPIFSLKEVEHGKYVSLKQLYLESNDPTEYRFAVSVFKDPNHWKHLCKLDWFKPYRDKWRRELKAQLRSRAIDSLFQLAGDNLQAIKTLATEDFPYHSFIELEDTPLKRRVGRPNKDKIKEVVSDETLADDAARIGLGKPTA